MGVVAEGRGKNNAALESTWMQGGGIEIPCRYKLHRIDKDRRNLCKLCNE